MSVTNHTFTAGKSNNDELTMSAVEVINGTHIADYQWVERLSSPSTSLDVTVTRPALLISLWWGSGGEGSTHVATPNNGFTIIDSLTSSGLLVQLSVATKSVTAGTYNVTWTAASGEGAQLWLIAVDEPSSSGTPALGGHVLSYNLFATGGTSHTSSPAITTTPESGAGSTIIIATGRGALDTVPLPTDSQGNTYTQVGISRAYNAYPTSGTSLFVTFPVVVPSVSSKVNSGISLRGGAVIK